MLRQVGADVSPAVADGVTGEAGCLFAVEDELTPADVARRESVMSCSSRAFCLAASTLSLA